MSERPTRAQLTSRLLLIESDREDCPTRRERLAIACDGSTTLGFADMTPAELLAEWRTMEDQLSEQEWLELEREYAPLAANCGCSCDQRGFGNGACACCAKRGAKISNALKVWLRIDKKRANYDSRHSVAVVGDSLFDAVLASEQRRLRGRKDHLSPLELSLIADVFATLSRLMRVIDERLSGASDAVESAAQSSSIAKRVEWLRGQLAETNATSSYIDGFLEGLAQAIAELEARVGAANVDEKGANK